MHDVNGTQLHVGDNVLIPARITQLCEGTEDFCNVTVETTLGRRPDFATECFSAVNTAQLVKVSGHGVQLGV